MDSPRYMIRGGFLTAEDRKDLIELARDGSAEHREVRVGVVTVRLYRRVSSVDFGAALAPTPRAFAVLDRSLAPGVGARLVERTRISAWPTLAPSTSSVTV
ncbi:hypothetical protein WCLP8_5180002 [uncultured Gammaproteobacteria bacterium]